MANAIIAAVFATVGLGGAPPVQSNAGQSVATPETKEVVTSEGLSVAKVPQEPLCSGKCASAAGAPAAAPGREEVKDLIRQVFGPAGEEAVAVASCETGTKFNTDADNGEGHLGLFQMGRRERALYGHGSDALTQIKAAYDYWIRAGWRPWAACR